MKHSANVDLDTVLSTITYHHDLCDMDEDSKTYTWEEPDVISFDELIVSWNAMRPSYGDFHINISVKIAEMWSPWFLYSSWGNGGQKGGNVPPLRFPLQITQDVLEVVDGQKATGFRIRIDAKEGANLEEFYSIHACASSIADVSPIKLKGVQSSINLKIPLVSQMKLSHPRHRDMCSPTATSAVVSFLLHKNRIDPVFFALQAKDEAFDIFGNWVLNTANASSILGKKWQCWVQRLNGFDEILDRLKANLPVIVSVRGPLEGSAAPYANGHLLVVKGYQHKDKRVLCMDPGFAEDEATDVSYDFEDFMEAWARRQFIAYIFEKAH